MFIIYFETEEPETAEIGGCSFPSVTNQQVVTPGLKPGILLLTINPVLVQVSTGLEPARTRTWPSSATTNESRELGQVVRFLLGPMKRVGLEDLQ